VRCCCHRHGTSQAWGRGNTRTTFVAAVSPSTPNYDETYSTLQFARRAMSVESYATANEISSVTSKDFQKLVETVKALDSENRRLREEVAALSASRIGGFDPATPAETAASSAHDHRDACGCGFDHGDERWRAREEELVTKFTAVIQHLQAEIANLNLQNSTGSISQFRVAK